MPPGDALADKAQTAGANSREVYIHTISKA
jgi:hypothetical protein